jgi:hypothetical protein
MVLGDAFTSQIMFGFHNPDHPLELEKPPPPYLKDVKHVLFVLPAEDHFVFCHINCNLGRIFVFDSISKVLKNGLIKSSSEDAVEYFVSEWNKFFPQDDPIAELTITNCAAPQQHNSTDCGAFACFFMSLAHQYLRNPNHPRDPSSVLPAWVSLFPPENRVTNSKLIRLWLSAAIATENGVLGFEDASQSMPSHLIKVTVLTP